VRISKGKNMKGMVIIRKAKLRVRFIAEKRKPGEWRCIIRWGRWSH
jgi:hypothetical protein